MEEYFPAYSWCNISVFYYIKNKWKILKNAPAYNNITKKSLFCLHEEVAIISHIQEKKLLSIRLEIISKCRHENKCLLSQFIRNG